jgi:hypothetical protein
MKLIFRFECKDNVIFRANIYFSIEINLNRKKTNKKNWKLVFIGY